MFMYITYPMSALKALALFLMTRRGNHISNCFSLPPGVTPQEVSMPSVLARLR